MRRFIHQVLLVFVLCTSNCWAQAYPQVRLEAKPADIAFVFIGGLGDESTGIVHQLYQRCPQLSQSLTESRGYYHWDGDEMNQPWPHLGGVMEDVLAFRLQNPQSRVVILGHSLGAVAALELAVRIPHTYLITLDPVDRQSSRQRPINVQWWGHAYISHSESARDILFQLAGRWGDCPTANISKNCDGRTLSSFGRRYIHDYAYDMFLSGNSEQKSLFELLRAQLRLLSQAGR